MWTLYRVIQRLEQPSSLMFIVIYQGHHLQKIEKTIQVWLMIHKRHGDGIQKTAGKPRRLATSAWMVAWSARSSLALHWLGNLKATTSYWPWIVKEQDEQSIFWRLVKFVCRSFFVYLSVSFHYLQDIGKWTPKSICSPRSGSWIF